MPHDQDGAAGPERGNQLFRWQRLSIGGNSDERHHSKKAEYPQSMESVRHISLLVVVLSILSCTACVGQPEMPFVGKAWLSTDSSSARGTIRVFLPDGTLLMDSCGETYRLARWTPIDSTRIAWEEDRARIEADVAQAAAGILELRLHLKSELKVEHYRLAQVPYVCPDSRF
jgi:hypothetical protein